MTNDEQKRKVAKTMLYRKPQKAQEGSEAQGMSPAPPLEQAKTKVAKTMLDHKLILDIRSRFGERENERLEQQISQRQLEPVKVIEPIKAEKRVSSCPFSWTEESAKVRFKHCAKCQRTIYDLDGMEQERVEALILKRENLDRFVLYERPDGKFMTSDCPVAQKRRIQLIGLVAVCVCAIALVAAFMMMQPPPTPAVDGASEPTSSDAASSKADASSPASTVVNDEGTTHHYEAGDPMPAVPAPDASKKKAPKSFSKQEQRGDFWQFPNGQPADDFTPAPGASSAN